MKYRSLLIVQFLLLLTLISSVTSLNAQQLFQKTYGIQDGLPEQETTGMVIDSLGQLWFQSGPENILEFNGYNFRNHHSSETGFSYESAVITANEYGIWFCKQNVCAYYNEGKWKNIPVNDKVRYIDFNNNGAHLWNEKDEYFTYDVKKQEYEGPFKYERSPLIPDKSEINRICHNISHDTKIVLLDGSTPSWKYLLSWEGENGTEEVLLENCNLAQLHDGTFIQSFHDRRPSIVRDRGIINKLPFYVNDSVFYNIGPKTYKFSYNPDSTMTYAFPVNISNDKTSTLFEYRNLETGMQGLGDIQLDYVNSYFYSGFNQHWITGQNGLLKVNDALMEYNPSNSGINTSLYMIVEDGDGKIWFGGYATGLSYYDGKKLRRINELVGREENMLGGKFFKDRNELLIFNESSSKILSLKNGKIKRCHVAITNSEKSVTGYTIDTLRNGRMVFGLHLLGLGLLEKRENDTFFIKSISHDKGLQLDNVLTVSQDKQDRIWAGRPSEGVAVYDIEKDTAITWVRTPDDPKSLGAISSHIDHKDNLWFGTNRGLYFFDKPHLFDIYKDSLFNVLEEIPLPNGDKSMVKFLGQKDSMLVFGNQSAVNFLDLNAFYKARDAYPIYQLMYGEDIGGKGSEQNAFFVDSKGYVWIGANDAATRIDMDRLQFDTLVNKIALSHVTSSGKKVDVDGKKIVLPAFSRNFSVTFKPHGKVSLFKNIFYDYDIINDKMDTIYSGRYVPEGNMSLQYISPGKYKLHVRAKKHGLVNDYQIYNLSVPMTLEENPLFWIILISAILGTTLLFFYNKNKQEKRLLKKDLALSHAKNEKDHLQVQSIISSFNPHFINNSLHWAQSRYRKDPSLVLLIDKLSENIRYIFNASSKGKAYHSLAEEMTLVENYVTIQKLRFESNFELIIPPSEQLDKLKNTPLFVMQLQIHIENAIEHGLRNRKESSFVRLDVEEKPQSIIFKITDDGVGRQKAENMNSRGTQKGTNMLERLHNIFNQNNTLKISTWYEDNIFEDASGTKHGTRVLIEIPNHYNYEL